MTLDPAVVIGAIAAMGGLLLFIVRSFMSGSLMSRNVVPREDYEALRTINASYPEAINLAVEAVKKLAASVDRIAASNGKDRP